MIFHLDQQTFSYGKRSAHSAGPAALSDISLSIKAGEKVALIGPSGAGKSSLLNLLYHNSPLQSAWCPQDGGLVDSLSVYNNIFSGGLERHSTLYNLVNLLRPFAAPRKEIEVLARQLGLRDKLFTSVDQLSGGQRQRVALGRALYRQQPVFLGDEPVSSLDPLQADELLALVLKQHETAIVSLHNRRLALNHFDRIITLRAGRIVFDGPSAGLTMAHLDAMYEVDASGAE
ncbi:ATP-binding cassette domain-containing protein [Thalassolituus oleivorans]|jgi:phosphonate transport system ATP-binding protein|uniref:ABC transporter-like protein n=1 Tax=Thalassolituus oleivorans MIL-1 TaxID=1298593 RepID=M5DT79_9GAMM|nr:ATP-binding cassette domain-containing protein [Thalassolituus oleivorans]MDF1641460.1 ATP-binding cassette domain-containing protein [Thalassolituus oleivorans]CCU72622.1 ABC transporter-like protein [Thalassolituus oleivorans MIL-1]